MAVDLPYPEEALAIEGISLSAVSAGLRKTNKHDLVLIEMAAGSRVAVSLTKNLFCAAPVTIVKEHLAITQPKYLLINAGNANAGTGDQGLIDANDCCVGLAKLTGCADGEVLPFSTGIIGQRLPVENIVQALPELLNSLDAHSWLLAAEAIMTTDTVPKLVSKKVKTKNGFISINGIAKGAGMICPNMATMLAYIATDARIDETALNALHQRLVEKSFNCISVDGDTSTNDACVLISTAKGETLTQGSDVWDEFEQALLELYQSLAQAIIRDGEGATKFVEINVVNGNSQSACDTIARTIAHSPLVKTALFASDANWGRILAAIGRAGVPLELHKISLSINNVVIMKNGQPAEGYSEDLGSEAMSRNEITITVDLDSGSAESTLWTTDLSHEYVSINADYRS